MSAPMPTTMDCEGRGDCDAARAARSPTVSLTLFGSGMLCARHEIEMLRAALLDKANECDRWKRRLKFHIEENLELKGQIEKLKAPPAAAG